MTSDARTAVDLFPHPVGEVLMSIEIELEKYFGQSDSFPSTLREISRIMKGEQSSSYPEDEDQDLILSASSYLTLQLESLFGETNQTHAEILLSLVKVIRATEVKTSTDPDWKKRAFVTGMPGVLISCFLDYLIRSLKASAASSSQTNKRFYSLLVETLASLYTSGSTQSTPDEKESCSFANHMIDVLAEELETIDRLQPFLAEACRQKSEKASATLIKGMMQAKSERVLRAFLQCPSANTENLLDWHTNVPPLAEFANRSIILRSRATISDAELWGDEYRTATRIKNSFQADFAEAVDSTFDFIRNTLIRFAPTGVALWLDEAFVAQSEWTKERTNYAILSDPSIAINLANVSFLLLRPMQNDDRKHFPRIPIEALYHPSCVAQRIAENTLDGPPPSEFHFTANLFFIGLNYFHLIAGMVAKVELMVPMLRMENESLREEGQENEQSQYHRKVLNTCYRQQMAISALLFHQKTMDNMRRTVLFVARWLVFIAVGESSVQALVGKSPSAAWRLVSQDLFWDIALILDHCMHYDTHVPFMLDEILYWIQFATGFVVNTALMTNKHHRGSYAPLLRKLCARCEYLMDEKTCERVVRTVLRMYVDLEALGTGKYNPRHNLNVLINELCRRRPKSVRYIRDRASDENDDFTKFISYSIADANYMLDDSILTLKSMNISFVRGGDGGEEETEENSHESGDPEDTSTVSSERTREGRLEALRGHMEFANQVLALLRTLCREMPDALLQGLVCEQVAYTLDYFLTQLAGPRMQEIANVPVKVLKEAGFDHREIVENLVHCYVGISLSCRREELKNAICSDGNYYSSQTFREIIRFLEGKAVCPEILAKLKRFFTEVESSYIAQKKEDNLFSDPPNEFLCQITYELLRNPLLLPGMDQVWVESKAILHHLLFDETNPFNRQVLSSNELLAFNALPDNHKKAETLVRDIEKWKAERRSSVVPADI